MALNTAGFYARLSKIRQLPLLGRVSPSSTHGVTRAELAGFRRAQNLAFDCARGVAANIQVGWSEQEATEWMDAFLRERHVSAFFHRPLCWFGERSRFQGFTAAGDALPTDRALQSKDEVVVVDLAPIVDGYVGDIGFAFSLAPNPELIAARKFMLELRENLPEWFASDMTTAEIWKKVDKDLKAAGYENCHVKYSFHVLGHRVHKMPLSWFPASVGGVYSLHGYWALISRGLFPELLSPWHQGEKIGLWAVEPHIGLKGEGLNNFGAKFEEILVVEKDRAYWLDDAPPHVKLPQNTF